ncbi:MAG: hypothetical protein ACFNS8_07370, partial [Kingella oralis]
PENVFAINHAPKGSLKKRNKPFSGCLCTHPILCQRRRFVAYHEQGQAPAPQRNIHHCLHSFRLPLT